MRRDLGRVPLIDVIARSAGCAERVPRDLHISIVSHGHYDLVRRLLRDLNQSPSRSRLQVSVVWNVSESGKPLHVDFPVRAISNPQPRGFAQNHNTSFNSPPCPSERQFFVVLNPDVSIDSDVFPVLEQALENLDGETGVIAPAVIDAHGDFDNNARALPTPIGILKKALGNDSSLINVHEDSVIFPDWIAGMFMMFPAQVFEAMRGFDESYFLYYEDVEICSRLWMSGFRVALVPTCEVIHDARRSSHHSLMYARWHLTSMLRLFSSSVYRRARNLHRHRVNRPLGVSNRAPP